MNRLRQLTHVIQAKLFADNVLRVAWSPCLYRSILHVIAQTCNTEFGKVSKEDVEMTANLLLNSCMNATRRDLFWHRPSANCQISCRTVLFPMSCAVILAPSISKLHGFLSVGPVSHVFELRTKSWTLCQEQSAQLHELCQSSLSILCADSESISCPGDPFWGLSPS